MTPLWVQLSYLLAAICFVLALKGLSSPKTARQGNILGAVGAAIATFAVFFQDEGGLDNVPLIIIAVLIDSVAGVVGAYRVQMTQMPQLVALFNGVGGGAASLVALLELHELDSISDVPPFILVATVFTIFVGAVSFAGSGITFGKLQELMPTRPIVFPGLPFAFAGSFLVALIFAVMLVDDPSMLLGILVALLGLALGVLLVLPVGGADVPIVISLLNAFTGLTVAAGGYVLNNTLLLVAGTLVGASGTLLTILMARGMGVPSSTRCSARSRAAPRWAPARPATARCSRPAPRTSRSCSATPIASSSFPAMAWRSPRRSTRCEMSSRCCRPATSRSTTPSTRWPDACLVT